MKIDQQTQEEKNINETLELNEKNIEKKLYNQGFKILSGDISFLDYGGTFYKKHDPESYTVIEIINLEEHDSNPKHKYLVTLSSVYLDLKDPETKQILKEDKESLYLKGSYTQKMKVYALYSYGARDHIYDIIGDNIEAMIDHIIDASYSYPWVQDYKDP
jgi:hypothetical protein